MSIDERICPRCGNRRISITNTLHTALGYAYQFGCRSCGELLTGSCEYTGLKMPGMADAAWRQAIKNWKEKQNHEVEMNDKTTAEKNDCAVFRDVDDGYQAGVDRISGT